MVKPTIQNENLQLKMQVRALKSEVTKLQTKNVKIETENLSLKSKVAATQKELIKQLKKGHLTVIVNRDVGEIPNPAVERNPLKAALLCRPSPPR